MSKAGGARYFHAPMQKHNASHLRVHACDSPQKCCLVWCDTSLCAFDSHHLLHYPRILPRILPFAHETGATNVGEVHKVWDIMYLHAAWWPVWRGPTSRSSIHYRVFARSKWSESSVNILITCVCRQPCLWEESSMYPPPHHIFTTKLCKSLRPIQLGSK